MGFTSCRTVDDPFTRRVRDAYGANVVRAPRAGIDPLDTLAVRGRRVEQRGRLAAMIEGAPLDLPGPSTSAVADLAGVRSASVDLSIGLSLTAAFLGALGIPLPGADVTASLWTGASGFSFEVRDVAENQVDVAVLGQALAGRRLAHTPATEVFFGRDGTSLLLITRTLTTRSFAIRATREGGQSVKVAVDAISDLLGKADVGVSWKTERDDSVAFEGASPATFAFAAVPCAVDAHAGLVFGLTVQDLTFGGVPVPDPVPSPVIDDDGLLVLDEPGPAI